MIENKGIRSIEKLVLLAKKIVEGYLLGLHRSPFHGFSAEFREHKQFNEGDNPKNIDYKVYARTDKLFTKKFDEETNLKCQMVLDISNSMYYPVHSSKNKLEFSIIAIASIMNLLKRQRDATGLTLFSDKIIQSIEAKLAVKTQQQIYSTLYPLLEKSTGQLSSNVLNCLDSLAYSLPKRSLIIVFSDFIDDMDSMKVEPKMYQDKFNQVIQHLIFQKHDLVLFYVMDMKTELDFQFSNTPHEFVDMESGEKVKLMPNEIQGDFQNYMVEKLAFFKNKCLQFGVDFVPVDMDDDYEKVLSTFLRKRNKMK